MTKRDTQLTRRRALAGIGAVGFATTGLARSRSTGNWNGYTNYTYAQTDDRRLLVGWQATYNGSGTTEVVVDGPTDRDDFVDGVTDVRLVDLDDVLPGDEGAASVGLRVEDGVEEGLRAWMRLQSRTGTDQASQALADRLQLDIRYDTGLLGLGGCEGADSAFVDFGEPIFSGNFTELATDGLAEGILLDPGTFDNGCLAPTDQRCIVFRWEFPIGGGNAGRGGSIDFDVAFGVDPCGAGTTNPFEPGASP